MYERFTDCARKAMQLANQEAQRFNHEYVGTEHILLGIVKLGEGVAAMTLKRLDVDLRKVRLEVEKIVQSGPDMVTMGKLPQTPRANKVIQYAMEEARNLNHNYVGTEHLLLGLLREQDGVAAQALMNLGLKLEDVREEVILLLNNKQREEPNGMPDEEVMGALKKLLGQPEISANALYDWLVKLVRGMQEIHQVMSVKSAGPKELFATSLKTTSVAGSSETIPDISPAHFVRRLKQRIESPGMSNRRLLQCMTLLIMKGQDILITLDMMSGIALTLHDPKAGDAPEARADDDRQDTLDGTPSHP